MSFGASANGWFHIQGKWAHFCIDCGMVSTGRTCADCYWVATQRGHIMAKEYQAQLATRRFQRTGLPSLTAAAAVLNLR